MSKKGQVVKSLDELMSRLDKVSKVTWSDSRFVKSVREEEWADCWLREWWEGRCAGEYTSEIDYERRQVAAVLSKGRDPSKSWKGGEREDAPSEEASKQFRNGVTDSKVIEQMRQGLIAEVKAAIRAGGTDRVGENISPLLRQRVEDFVRRYMM